MADWKTPIYAEDVGAGFVSLEAIPTLRDKFAMAALTGLLANLSIYNSDIEYSSIHLLAYEFADKMLEARDEDE